MSAPVTPAPIGCQTRGCDGDMTEDEALESLRELGYAWCATCRELERFCRSDDDQVDSDLDRRAGL